jgi:hypothetical protein
MKGPYPALSENEAGSVDSVRRRPQNRNSDDAKAHPGFSPFCVWLAVGVGFEPTRGVNP